VRAFVSALVLLLGITAFSARSAEEPPAPEETEKARKPAALVMRLDGPIGPATKHFITRGIRKAAENGNSMVILEMDTPGGLDASMRDIIKEILASPVPVVTYVAPNGARAASAGCYILYASHIAAMAPATNTGSATPVSIAGEPEPESEPASREREKQGDDKAGDKDDKSSDAADEPTDPPARMPGSAMERKVVNDSVAYIRGLAELRGRNADWAEKAVREGVNLQASAALQQKVIDLIATDMDDLLKQIDGRKVRVAANDITLNTGGLELERHEADWRIELLSVITNPTVAYGLLLIGIYGLMLEGYNPGAILPGVVGAICLLLGLFALQVLPVNYAGLALMALGVLLIISEAFVPSFGTLGLGGLIAFVIGSIILFDTDVPGFGVAMPVIAGIAVAGGLVLAGIVWIFARARRSPVVTGAEQILGSVAEAAEDFTGDGRVRIGGEYWNARSPAPVKAGQRVRVLRMDGLTLTVEPLPPEFPENRP
jgi:membrane-bound serine protease (ClpP class)